MGTVTFGDFEWDDAKAASNLSKHGVSFFEAATVFDSADAKVVADASHTDRAVTVGFSASSRVLLVVSTETTDRTRIISARRASPAERRAFSAR